MTDPAPDSDRAPETNSPCRLYLIAPGSLAPDDLTPLAEAADIACLLLRDADAQSRALIAAAQVLGIAVLLPEDSTLALSLGADGVHLASDTGVQAARRVLGKESIVGVDCGTSRHAAMLAGEAEADYVAFTGRENDPEEAADPELLNWWQVMMTLPCVAMGRVRLDQIPELAEAGADFIALEQAVWEHPQGPAAALGEAQRGIEESLAE